MDCPVSVVKMWSGIPFLRNSEKRDKINKEKCKKLWVHDQETYISL